MITEYRVAKCMLLVAAKCMLMVFFSHAVQKRSQGIGFLCLNVGHEKSSLLLFRTSGYNIPRGTILLSTLSTLFLLVLCIVVLVTIYYKNPMDLVVEDDKHDLSESLAPEIENHV